MEATVVNQQKRPDLALRERFELLRTLLDNAMTKQRESWDIAFAAQELAGCMDLDVYALVAELAGALDDDESIPDSVVERMIVSD